LRKIFKFTGVALLTVAMFGLGTVIADKNGADRVRYGILEVVRKLEKLFEIF
jgi:hypothetical protein